MTLASFMLLPTREETAMEGFGARTTAEPDFQVAPAQQMDRFEALFASLTIRDVYRDCRRGAI